MMIQGIVLQNGQDLAKTAVSQALDASGGVSLTSVDSYLPSAVQDSRARGGGALFSVASVPPPAVISGEGMDIGEAARKIESFDSEKYNVMWESGCEGIPQETLVSEGRTLMVSSSLGGNHQVTAYDANGAELFREALPDAGPFVFLAASEDGKLYCRGQDKTCAIDENGKSLWEINSGRLDTIGPDGTLYVVTCSGALDAYDHDTGELKWRRRIKKSETTFDIGAPITGKRGIYFRAGGEIHACDFQGMLRFKIPCPEEKTISPGKDDVIRLFSCGKMEAWSPDDGHKIGEYSAGAAFIIHPPPPVGEDGSSYLCEGVSSVDERAHVRAVYPDGSLKWQTSLLNEPENIVMSGDLLFVNTRASNGTIYAMDRETGRILWEYAAPGLEELRPDMVLQNGTLIAIGYETHYRHHEPNEIHAISPDGEKRWTFKMNGENLSLLGYGADSEILIRSLRGGSERSSIYSLKDETLMDYIKREGNSRSSPVIEIDADNGEIVIGGVHLPIQKGSVSGISG